MAKLKGPLFSLGASQQLGKALVFFGWKGLDVVREYVIPSNPRTSGQTTQRGYLTAAVAGIHTAMAHATQGLAEADQAAYALWASVVQSATTWFNQAVRNWVDQLVAGLTGNVFGNAVTTPGANQLFVAIGCPVTVPTGGDFYWGTSKTALINHQAGTPVGLTFNTTILALTTGVKYFWQFRATAPAGCVGQRTGIYYGVAA